MKSIYNFRTEKAAVKTSAAEPARGRSRQRKAKKVKSYAEQDDNDDEEGIVTFIF